MRIHCKAVRVSVAILATTLLALPTALAAPPKTKSLVVLRVAGDALSAPERTALTDTWRKELAGYPSVTLVPTPDADLIDLMFDAECVEPDTGCLVDIGKAQKADLLIFSEATAKGGGYELKAKLVDVGAKKALKDASKSAPSASALSSAIPDATVALLGKKPAPPAPKLVALKIRTTPAEAAVFVNDHAVGRTPAAFEGKPGGYTLRITKDGYQDIIRKVELEEGKPLELDLELEPIAVAAPVPVPGNPPIVQDEDEFYETWWFWTIVGAGAAGATVGILAGVGAFDAEPTPVGNTTLLVGQRPDQDFLLQLQRK